MKTVRILSVVLAVALFVTAFTPFAVAPAAAQSALNTAIGSPLQAFTDAAQGLSLLSPMSIGLPLISINTQSASSAYKCTFLSQTPLDWTKMKSRQSFDMVWTVQNSGTATWHTQTEKLIYVSGTKMQSLKDEYKLSKHVSPGEKIKLTVDMIAPKALGTYSTLWGIYTNKTRFCNVTITITVVR
jgi:hypothetical protein